MKLSVLVLLVSTAGCAVGQAVSPPPLAAASPSPTAAVTSPSPPTLPSPTPSPVLVVAPLESPLLPPVFLPNNTAPTAPAANFMLTSAADLAAAVPSPSPSPSLSPSLSPTPSPSPSPLPTPVPSPSPSPVLALSSLSPAPLELPPLPAATNATAAPNATARPVSLPANVTAATPKAATTAANASAAGNATYVAASPLVAIQSTPHLAALAELGTNTSFNKVLADTQLVATIFAPTNAAVDAAVAFLEESSKMAAAELKEQGIVEQLLQYHVAEGAALLSSEFENNQVLTMLDGNKTRITIEEAGALRLLAAATNRTVYINSDSQQQAQLVGPAIQARRSIIHTIDAVFVPQALIDEYKLATKSMPGFVPGAVGVAPSSAPQVGVVAPAPRSSAHSTAAAGLLTAMPLLAAMLWA